MSDTSWVVGEFVEAVQLQVVCQTLINKLAGTTTTITQEHLDAYGDIEKALQMFYEDSIREVVKKTKKLPQANGEVGVKEGFLRKWFEKNLITAAGTRGLVYRGSTHTAGLINEAVDVLDQSHIIREERRGGGTWYELSHDRFIDPIFDSNREWLIQFSGSAQTRQWLEERAAKWSETQHEEQLLDEAELTEADRWVQSPEAKEVGYDVAVTSLLQASRTKIANIREHAALQLQNAIALEKSARRFRRLAYALAVVSVLAIGFAIWGYRQKVQAARLKAEAVESRLTAENLSATANGLEAALVGQRTDFENQVTKFRHQAAQDRLQIQQEREKAATLTAESKRRKAQADGAFAAAHAAMNLAQTQADIREQSEQANRTEKRGDHFGAIRRYERLRNRFAQQQDPAGQANMLYNMAYIFKSLSDDSYDDDLDSPYGEIEEPDAVEDLAENYRDNALKHFNDALSLYRQALPSDSAKIFMGDTLANLADMNSDEEPEEAIKLYEQALPLYHGTETSAEIFTINKLVRLLGNTKNRADYGRAIVHARTLIPLYDQLNRPGLKRDTYKRIGGMEESIGDYASALSDYENALKLTDEGRPRDRATLLQMMAVMQVALNQKASALDNYLKALLLVPSPTNSTNAGISLSISKLYFEMRNYPQALKYSAQARTGFHAAIATTNSGSPTITRLKKSWKRSEADSLKLSADLYELMNDRTNAISALSQAVSLYKELFDLGAQIALYNRLAKLYEANGNPTQAREAENNAKSAEAEKKKLEGGVGKSSAG